MKANLKCWDDEAEKWIYDNNEDAEFSFNNGKWKVRYTVEKNFKGNIDFPAEIDAPVWVEVENPQIFIHFLHETQVHFYLSIPINK